MAFKTFKAKKRNTLLRNQASYYFTRLKQESKTKDYIVFKMGHDICKKLQIINHGWHSDKVSTNLIAHIEIDEDDRTKVRIKFDDERYNGINTSGTGALKDGGSISLKVPTVSAPSEYDFKEKFETLVDYKIKDGFIYITLPFNLE